MTMDGFWRLNTMRLLRLLRKVSTSFGLQAFAGMENKNDSYLKYGMILPGKTCYNNPNKIVLNISPGIIEIC
jgi:hypothetical protein